MLDPVFPPKETTGWSEGEDQSLYGVKLQSNAVEIETEDGYSWGRPRSTRKPPKVYTTGFTMLDQDHYSIFEQMWDEFGMYKTFTWFNPVLEKNMEVKFAKEPDVTYQGLGKSKRYNIKVELKTA